MSPKDVSLAELRQVIAQGAPGQYACAYSSSVDLQSWSRQALELEIVARSKGYWARSHPTVQGNGTFVDLVVVRIQSGS